MPKASTNKKKQKRRPTQRQLKLAKLISENLGNKNRTKSMYEMMLEAGYSKEQAENSHQIVRSDGVQSLLEEMLPDSLVFKKHKALLNKEMVMAQKNNRTGKIEVIRTGEIDANAVAKGVDMAYKLKGRYAPEKHQVVALDIDEERFDKLLNYGRERKTA